MRRWFRSITGRITLVTVGVSVVAVLVTGLVSLQLVRSSTISEAKQELAAQAELLARMPATSALQLAERLAQAPGDAELAMVDADGAVSGPAADSVGPAMLRRIRAGHDVSAVVRRDGETLVLEARQRESGGAVVVVRSQDSLELATRNIVRRLLIALGIGLVVAIAAGTVLGRVLAGPLVRTAATARRMAAGERGIPAAATRPTEVGDVAEALTTLDAALTSSEGRQREFLLSISHELRTPLTALRGYGEAMTDGLIHEAEIHSVGATLVAETERLDRFVADLLELARLEADDFAIDLSEVDVAATLDAAARAWAGRASILEVAVVVEAEPGLLVTTDDRRLRQVVDGLIENALRVSPPGTTVTLSARPGVVIAVRDSGPGLAAEDLAVAFDRGALRARYAGARPVGTGLGLSIAQRLVQRLGGTISAENAPDGGAIFSVRLSPAS
ncbi:HAMP domain-containing sensor histidine kinase [soil metagenome]